MNIGGAIRVNKNGFLIIMICSCLYLIYLYSGSKSTELNNNMVSLRKLLIAAIEAAENGGKEVYAVSKTKDLNIKSKGKTKEGVLDSVTDADFKSHCAMYNSLKNNFPSVNIVSEEDNPNCQEVSDLKLSEDEFAHLENVFESASDVTIWIDPLDATKEFTEKLYQYVTTMVCVAVNGVPTIGVIHKPFERKTSWAWVNHGGSHDILNVKNASSEPLRVIISRSHAEGLTQTLKTVFGSNINVTLAAGAGYKILEVAYGDVSTYIHQTAIKKWDLCAGNAIIRYLKNGQMTTWKNDLIDYKNGEKTVITNGIVASLSNHDWYIEKLQEVV